MEPRKKVYRYTATFRTPITVLLSFLYDNCVIQTISFFFFPRKCLVIGEKKKQNNNRDIVRCNTTMESPTNKTNPK